MIDPKVTQLAKVLVEYSTRVKKGEYVQINGDLNAKELITEIYKLVIKKGAYPIVHVGLPGLAYFYYKNASMEQLKHFPDLSMDEVKKSQVYIGIGAESNTRELSNTDPKRIAIRQKVTNPISDYIVNRKDKIRRVSVDFPTNALAQDAEMSLEEYENFLFNATNQDWENLKERMYKVKKVLDNAEKIQIIGEDTDIEIGVKDRPFIIDAGEENMPGGEIFNAPHEKSVNGRIHFTYPAIRSGREVEDIILEFKNGKVVEAKARKNEKFLKEMIKMDKGSSYIGELGIGFNPKITRFTKNLLFDEKKHNSIHLALGMAYKECKGTNKSALHWDIVKDMNKGIIYADDRKVFVNGWKV